MTKEKPGSQSTGPSISVGEGCTKASKSKTTVLLLTHLHPGTVRSRPRGPPATSCAGWQRLGQESHLQAQNQHKAPYDRPFPDLYPSYSFSDKNSQLQQLGNKMHREALALDEAELQVSTPLQRVLSFDCCFLAGTLPA